MREAEVATNRSTDTARKTRTKPVESAPAGSARPAVRGFAASISRSASRLCAIAALRAPTIASRIFPTVIQSGMPRAASTAESSANGSAKSVWENLIISRVVRADRASPGRELTR